MRVFPDFILNILLTQFFNLPIPQKIRQIIYYSFSERFLIGVLGLVTNEEEKILLFYQPYLEPNSWTLPGGFAKHKSLKLSLQNEIMEESGLLVEVYDDFRVVRDVEKRINFLFKCKVIDGDFKSGPEVAEVGYFSLDNLPQLGDSSRKILESLAYNDVTAGRSNRLINYTEFIDIAGVESLGNIVRPAEENRESREVKPMTKIDREPSDKVTHRKIDRDDIYIKRGFYSFDTVYNKVVPLPPFAVQESKGNFTNNSELDNISNAKSENTSLDEQQD